MILVLRCLRPVGIVQWAGNVDHPCQLGVPQADAMMCCRFARCLAAPAVFIGGNETEYNFHGM